MKIRLVVCRHKLVTFLVLFLFLASAQLYAAQICDINEDNVVQEDDIDLIFQAKNLPAITPFDPKDIDRNGIINTDDARQCVCALPTTADCEPPLNQSPVANAGADQSLTQAVFSIVNLNGTASDPDTDPVSVNWAFQEVPVGSQAVLSASNTLTPSFTPDQYGRYIVVLTATDAFDASSNSTVTIDIESPPSDLQAVADSASVDSGNSVTGNLLDNDQGGTGNLSVNSINQNVQQITLGSQFATDAGGALLVQSNGSYSYDSPANLESQIQETFVYNVADQSNASSSAELIITVNPLTVPPPASLQANPDTNSAVVGGATITGNVLDNDQFSGQQPLVTALPRSSQPRGTFSLSNSGAYSYIPPSAARSGFVEQFAYRITTQNGESDTSLITIQVELAALLPVAIEDNATATAAGSAISGNVVSNDNLGNQPARVTPLRTNLRTDIGGLFTLQSNGGFTYLPPQTLEINSTESFDYTLIDLDGQRSDSRLIITVNPEDRTPLANPDSAIVDAGGSAVSGNVLDNDEPGNQPTVVSPVRLNSTTDLGGVLTIQANGVFSYLPPQILDAATQQETFDYAITDNDGQASSSTLTITINQGNLIPVANPDQDSAIIGGPEISGNVLTNDVLGDEPTQLGGVQSDLTTNQGGLFNLDANGNYTYMPPSQINGSVFDEQFDYSITDNNGDISSSTLTIMVTQADILPLANPDTNTATAGGTAVVGNVLANDNPGNQPTVVTPVNLVDTSFGDSFNLIASGEYTYMPPSTVVGVVSRVFNYTITDSNGQTSSSTVTITVNPQPVMLVCNPDAGEVVAGSEPIQGNVLTNDITNGQPVQVTPLIISNTDNGGSFDLQADGSFSYTPPASVPGVVTDEFSYTVTSTLNPDENCNSTVTITINQEDLIPQARPDQNSVTAGSGFITGNVLVNDDPGNPLTVVTAQSIGQTSIGGSFTLNEEGSYAYTPPSSVQGVETELFNYTITDADLQTSQSTLTITVNPVNLVPFARPDTASVKARAGSNGVQGNVLDNDDLGNQPSAVTPIVNATTQNQGLLNIGSDGLFLYNPPPFLAGIVTEVFDYELIDNDGEMSISTLSVTVTPACRAQNDQNNVVAGLAGGFFSVVQRNSATGNVISNDLFCTPTVLVTPITQQTNLGGSLTLQDDGSYVYLAPTFVATQQNDVFNYTVTDAEGDSSDAQLTITVFPDLSPNAVNDSDTANVGGPDVNGDVTTNDDLGNLPTTVTLQGSNAGPFGGMLTMQSNGQFIYTPPSSGGLFNNSSEIENFTYQLTDVDGDTSTATLTFIVDNF